MQLTIFGATGGTGKQLVEQVLVLQRYFGDSSFNSRSLRFRCERYAA